MNGEWAAACPVCRAALAPFAPDLTELPCAGCGTTWPRTDGVWRMVHPERAADIDGFLADYLIVRHAEGRAHAEPDWYRALPSTLRDDPMHEQWRMRSASLQHLTGTIVGPATRYVRRPLRIVDLGAGVGWLSHQFRQNGHQPIAIDVNVDPGDGLVATRHLAPDWPVVQAHFDHLPLPDDCADLAIFNASLHYTTDPVATLAEARRIVGRHGLVIVMDSPLYRRERDGDAMLAERARDFEQRFGTRSDTLPSVGYLTMALMRTWGREVGLRWTAIRPWYGWRWAARPWAARLHHRRAPSRFRILVGRPVSGARARS